MIIRYLDKFKNRHHPYLSTERRNTKLPRYKITAAVVKDTNTLSVGLDTMIRLWNLPVLSMKMSPS
jgi:hypothetical protein